MASKFKDRFREQQKKLKDSIKITTKMQKILSDQEIQQRKIFEKENIFYIQRNFEDIYIEQATIGEGTSGLVKIGIRIRDNQQFAIKIVKTEDEEKIKNIIEEFKSISKLDHRNIVKVYELYIDEVKGKVYLIMEYIPCKEMFQVISEMGSYSEEVASNIFKQILLAIKYLHDNGVCHRDLKPNNILTNVEGTVAFSAPEIFQNIEYNNSVDIWSSGVVLYTMMSGQQPFNAEYLQDLIKQIIAGDYSFPSNPWDEISDSVKNLIQLCLQIESQNRIKPSEALLHPWITQKQNTSPLTVNSLNNLQNNKERNLTKYSLYKELGLIKDNQNNNNRKQTFGIFDKNNKQDQQFYKIIANNMKNQNNRNKTQKSEKEKEEEENKRSQSPHTDSNDDEYDDKCVEIITIQNQNQKNSLFQKIEGRKLKSMFLDERLKLNESQKINLKVEQIAQEQQNKKKQKQQQLINIYNMGKDVTQQKKKFNSETNIGNISYNANGITPAVKSLNNIEIQKKKKNIKSYKNQTLN